MRKHQHIHQHLLYDDNEMTTKRARINVSMSKHPKRAPLLLRKATPFHSMGLKRTCEVTGVNPCRTPSTPTSTASSRAARPRPGTGGFSRRPVFFAPQRSAPAKFQRAGLISDVDMVPKECKNMKEKAFPARRILKPYVKVWFLEHTAS